MFARNTRSHQAEFHLHKQYGTQLTLQRYHHHEHAASAHGDRHINSASANEHGYQYSTR